ncbi:MULTISPECIES: tetratricopeptide repeat protein [Paenibacillus]|uniref:tetratricopeptide repeat protein n=1 Tax=Paenibacillus TaxID=44249 RepID=UPI000F52990B|nr:MULTISPECIES: tetratricopeptide repeat protein [Paenibacillus]KAA8745540.1 hypothetical protein FE296_27165 [Paenibacillus sp. UASWS1643]RPK31299.1 hypothetical protein EDO6_01926 [Paenibacillus xylanexedens]
MKKLEQQSPHNGFQARFYILTFFWRFIYLLRRDASSLYHLGNVYFAHGHQIKAMQLWNNAVVKDQNHSKAWHNLVQAAVSKEEWTLAATGLSALCRMHPDHLEYATLFSQILKKQNRTNDLKELYLNYVDRVHKKWATTELALLYIRTHQEKEACTLLTSYVKDHPQDAYGWRLLGMSHMKVKNYPLALEALQESYRLHADNEVKSWIVRIKLVEKKEGERSG